MSAGCYDVEFADDGSVERGVAADELRPRRTRLELPEEVWVPIGRATEGKRDLCTFECLGRVPRSAGLREQGNWWARAFHDRFRRCGSQCDYDNALASGGQVAAANAVAKCIARALVSDAPMAQLPWKERYAERDAEFARSAAVICTEDFGEEDANAKKMYSVSGRHVNHVRDSRVNYGKSPLMGWYFDPRLGVMVREGG